MEAKKTNRASLENKRAMFLEIGLIAALAFVLTSFEWNSSTKEVASISDGRISLSTTRLSLSPSRKPLRLQRA